MRLGPGCRRSERTAEVGLTPAARPGRPVPPRRRHVCRAARPTPRRARARGRRGRRRAHERIGWRRGRAAGCSHVDGDTGPHRGVTSRGVPSRGLTSRGLTSRGLTSRGVNGRDVTATTFRAHEQSPVEPAARFGLSARCGSGRRPGIGYRIGDLRSALLRPAARQHRCGVRAARATGAQPGRRSRRIQELLRPHAIGNRAEPPLGRHQHRHRGSPLRAEGRDLQQRAVPVRHDQRTTPDE